MGVLDGKVAVISRGTGGVGARAAALFVDEGASVVIGGRRTIEGQELATRLGPRASFVRTDMGVESDVEALIGTTVARLGRIDVLVNNVGVGGPSSSSWGALDLDRFWAILAFHVDGLVASIKHAAPVMGAQGWGSIVNVTGTASGADGATELEYSTARAAVVHLTQRAATELAPHGIRVNSVSPDCIPPGLSGEIPGADRPDDVAQVLLWLASDASSQVNGRHIAVADDEAAAVGVSGSVSSGATTGRPISLVVDERKQRLADFA